MNIQSATYTLDPAGEKVGIVVVDDEGNIMNVPLGGVNWVNQAVDNWIAEGNSIAPGTVPIKD